MIIVTDKIFIDSSDGLNYIAKKTKISESGKSKGNEVNVLIGYYPSVEAALRGILRNEYGGRISNTTMTIQEAIAQYEKLTQEVIRNFEVKNVK